MPSTVVPLNLFTAILALLGAMTVGLCAYAALTARSRAHRIRTQAWQALCALGYPPADCAALAVAEAGRLSAFLQMVASIAPFLGLASTVHDVGSAMQTLAQGADVLALAGPLGAALGATLAGLLVGMAASAADYVTVGWAERLEASLLMAPPSGAR